jgi:hypothetical protein
MVEAERVTYGENSYFERVEEGLSTQPTFVQGRNFEDGIHPSIE